MEPTFTGEGAADAYGAVQNAMMGVIELYRGDSDVTAARKLVAAAEETRQMMQEVEKNPRQLIKGKCVPIKYYAPSA